MQSLNDMRRAPSVTWQERGHTERARSIGRRSRKAVRDSASLQRSALPEHSPDSSIRDILTPYSSSGRKASGLHSGLPQRSGLLHSHVDAVRSFIRGGRGSTVLHTTANQEPHPRHSPEGVRLSLSNSRDSVILQSPAPQELSHNGSAGAAGALRSSVNSDGDDTGLRAAMSQQLGDIIYPSDASRAQPMDSEHDASLPAASASQSRFASSMPSLSCTEDLMPAFECSDTWRPASEGGPADSTFAGEAVVINTFQTPQPQVSGEEQAQLKASQPLVHDAALITASSRSADQSPETGAVTTGTLDRSSSDATHRLSNAEAAEEIQLLEADDTPDLSGFWADAMDLDFQGCQRDELRSSEATEKAQVLQLYGELIASKKAACLQEAPCLNGLSSTKMVQKARLSQSEVNADTSGHTEDLIHALFWEAQEAHISAMHVELASSLARDVDIESWASEASRLPIDIADEQLETHKEQKGEVVSQPVDTAIPDNLQQEAQLGSSREAFLSIAAVSAADMPDVSSSLPCASPLTITPDITLQASAMDVPCAKARDSLVLAPGLCHSAPVSGAAAQEDTTAVSASQEGLQRSKGQKQRTGRSAKKGCSTRHVIMIRARGQGLAKAATRHNDKAEILAAILALQIAVSEQAASIAQLKEEVWMKSGQTSVGCPL